MEPIMHIRQKHCEFCGQFFIPDRRIGNKQRCCPRPACRKLRKAASQAKWAAKNEDYFKARYEDTKVWRAAHPEYQRERRKKIHEIQDTMAQITVLDSDTYIITATGVRYKTRLAEAVPKGIS